MSFISDEHLTLAPVLLSLCVCDELCSRVHVLLSTTCAVTHVQMGRLFAFVPYGSCHRHVALQVALQLDS